MTDTVSTLETTRADDEILRAKNELADDLAKFVGFMNTDASAESKLENVRLLHGKCTRYFNLVEQSITNSGHRGSHTDRRWTVEKAETCLNVLGTVLVFHDCIMTHLSALGCSAAEFAADSTAYANIQRLVAEHYPEQAKTFHTRFAEKGLPTHGFDHPLPPYNRTEDRTMSTDASSSSKPRRIIECSLAFEKHRGMCPTAGCGAPLSGKPIPVAEFSRVDYEWNCPKCKYHYILEGADFSHWPSTIQDEWLNALPMRLERNQSTRCPDCGMMSISGKLLGKEGFGAAERWEIRCKTSGCTLGAHEVERSVGAAARAQGRRWALYAVLLAGAAGAAWILKTYVNGLNISPTSTDAGLPNRASQPVSARPSSEPTPQLPPPAPGITQTAIGTNPSNLNIGAVNYGSQPAGDR